MRHLGIGGLLLLSVLFLHSRWYSRPDSSRFEPVFMVQGLEEYQKLLANFQSPDFQLQSVENEGGVLRADVILNHAIGSEAEAEARIMETMHQLQAVVGRGTPLSVWARRPTPAGRLEPAGMVFFSAATEIYHFKSARELR